MRKWMLLGIFAAAALAADARPARAGCFTNLADCYQRAANIDSFWYRWAAGLDCELDLVECTREKLIGT
jgi:hypothetical protein